MVKFTAKLTDGRKLIGFGLSRDNCKRLLEGEPISFIGTEVGEPNLEFAIVGGETEDAIHKEITTLLTKNTNDLPN